MTPKRALEESGRLAANTVAVEHEVVAGRGAGPACRAVAADESLAPSGVPR